MQRDDHLGAVAGHCLVYCVVDHFPDEVMQTSKTGGTDVHAWAFANRVETFKNLDVFRAISGGAGCCRLCGFAGGHQLLATCEDGKNEELRGINNTLKSTNYFVRVLRFTRTSMPTMVLAVADESDASSCGSRNLICVAHDASSTSTCNRWFSIFIGVTCAATCSPTKIAQSPKTLLMVSADSEPSRPSSKLSCSPRVPMFSNEGISSSGEFGRLVMVIEMCTRRRCRGRWRPRQCGLYGLGVLRPATALRL